MNRVIVSSNENLTYLQFWPMCAAAWRRIGVEPALVLVTDKPRDKWRHMEAHGEVIPMATRSDIPPGNWSKVARWTAYPRWPNDLIMTCCIEMLPINREYFDWLFSHDRDALVVGSADAYKDTDWAGEPGREKFPGGYMVATGRTWGEIVNPDCLYDAAWVDQWRGLNEYDDKEDIENAYGNYSEESTMRVAVYRWDPDGERTIKLDRPGGWSGDCRRIDRSDWKYELSALDRGHYLDAHCIRPVMAYPDALRRFCLDIGLDRGLVDAGIEEASWAEHIS